MNPDLLLGGVAMPVTVPMRCAVCGSELFRVWDSMLPPLPLGRVRICRQCKRAVCRRHSKRVARDTFECVECAPTAK